MKSFEELNVWQKAHALVLAIYSVTARFPAEERYGIVSQLRRAGASVAANIAEGFSRHSTKEFLRYLDLAGGSLGEVRYFLLLSRDLRHLDVKEYARLREQSDEVGRLLGGLVRSLRKRLGASS